MGPMPSSSLSDVAHVIQLSVAPVFLLTALGTLLGVLSTRLGRIVDRVRVLSDRLPAMADAPRAKAREEVALLVRRRRRVNAAITFATGAALLVCVLIACAFVGSMVRADMSPLVAALFVGAMLAFICALVAFLSEVLLAVRTMRIEIGP